MAVVQDKHSERAGTAFHIDDWDAVAGRVVGDEDVARSAVAGGDGLGV